LQKKSREYLCPEKTSQEIYCLRRFATYDPKKTKISLETEGAEKYDVRCAACNASQLLSIIVYEHNKYSNEKLPVARIPSMSPEQPFDSELHAPINFLAVKELFQTLSTGRGFPPIKRKFQEFHMTSCIVARLPFSHSILS
jgi:hypothetical protein